MKYIKLPVEVDAVQFSPASFKEVIDLLGHCAVEPMEDECYVGIDTLEGVMDAYEGDWIIKGIKGEFYPCKPDIFNLTYKVVADPTKSI